MSNVNIKDSATIIFKKSPSGETVDEIKVVTMPSKIAGQKFYFN
ncbi:hypothetical protein BL14DL4_00174 [Bacillus licheniformis]|nr:hypothetical protein BL14DL4_00174 [Bacillus licheniformis]